jgi:hypothetical protein
MHPFQLTSGTVMGVDHHRVGKPNQDAYKVFRKANLIAAVVCDGCGDPTCAHSEFGSRFGAEFIASGLVHGYQGSENHASLLQSVYGNLLSQMNEISKTIGTYNVHSSLSDFFLFTVVGCLVDNDISTFFSIGDGTIYINGEKLAGLGPYPNNAPPYVSYALCSSPPEESLAFTIHRQMRTDDLQTFLIGSDGVEYIEKSEGLMVPNGKSKVGPVSQFWTEDIYFTNGQRANQRLGLMNREHLSVDWEAKRIDKNHGLLLDDVTLVAGRRDPDAHRLSGR